MNEVVKVLCDLVSIPSVNPMGKKIDGQEYTEKEVAEYIKNYFKKASIDVGEQEVLPGRSNIIAQVSGRDKPVLFETHMDTVPVEGMKIEPFNPVIKNGRIYGRGADDAKGSLAAMMVAVKRAAESKARRSVIFAAVVDEEYMHEGVDRLIKSGIKIKEGIVGEPTKLNIVIATKGAVRWKIRTKGKTAHSSDPDRGINAIYEMCRIIGFLEEYSKEQLNKKPHPLLGNPTLSVGKIGGGQAVNIVPGFCEIEIDRRTLPGEDVNEVLSEIKEYIENSSGSPIDYEMEKPLLIDPSMEVAENIDIVELAKKSMEAIGMKIVVEGVFYGTDASKLNMAGIPTIVVGPGDINQAHSEEEYIEIHQVENACRFYEKVLT